MTLDGSSSTAPEGIALIYRWFESPGNPARDLLSDTTSVTPSFVPTLAGDYVFRLQVIGSDGSSDLAVVTVTVTAPEEPEEPVEEIEVFTFAIPGGSTMDFVWVEPGTFRMGMTAEEETVLQTEGLWDRFFEREQPANSVTVTRGYYLGQYEVSPGQWEAVMFSAQPDGIHPHPYAV